MTSPPLIGVTTSEVRLAEQVEQTPQGEPPRREMALGMTYLKAIEAAGGLPVVMPPLELGAVEPLLDRLDGVCLSGGPDLDPEAYHDRRHPELGPVEPELDRFELALARAADVRGLPILAICRGAQALNVARGGTLYQHLPDRPGTSIGHRQRRPGEQTTHAVDIAPGSLLARVMRRSRARVNSFHTRAYEGSGPACGPPPGPPTGSSRESKRRRAHSCWGYSGTRRPSPPDASRRPSSRPWCGPSRRPAPCGRRRERAPRVGGLARRLRVHRGGRGGADAPRPARLENRFLAARDGMEAELIDPQRECRVPARDLLDELLDACGPHAGALGCERELRPVRTMAQETGAVRQLRLARGVNRLRGLVETLADEFCRTDDPHEDAPAGPADAAVG